MPFFRTLSCAATNAHVIAVFRKLGLRPHRILSSILCSLALVAMAALPAAAGDAPPLMMTPGNFGVSAMGASTYTIPIIVPPGTGGMAPALSIDY